MYVPAQNVTDGQIVIDGDGRTLGGGEWGAVDRHDPVAQAAIGASRIAIHPDLDAGAADVDPAALAAYERARTLEGRRAELANLTGDQVHTISTTAGYADPAVELSPDEYGALVRRLEHSDVSLSHPSPVDDEPGTLDGTEPSPGPETDGTGAPDLPKPSTKRGAAK